tara:strand:- start:172 stop:1569 length:1398 start_codon:yes stop_codon:yes gene_type:complete
MTFRTLPEPVFKIPSPNDLCKETYRVSQSREHFNKAISLIRKLAWCGDVSITDWDTEEKNIFSGAIIFYSIDKTKVRKAVLKSLTPCQVITLLQQVHDIDWLSFNDTKKDWFSDPISIKAMASLLDSEGLRVIRDDVFGGTDGYGMQKYMMLDSFRCLDIIRINAIVSTDAMRMVCFPNGIPVNRLLSVVRKLSDADCGPEIFKLVADTMQSNIARGDVTADATEDLLWKNISNIPEYYRLSFIKAIYPDPFVPKTECWTKLIFGHGQLCNTWNEEDGGADPSMGEDIPDTPFCTDCAQESDGDHNDQASCHCRQRFHLDICSWLMQKGVPIPAGFWEQVAYYNLYHFAYFLHVDRPKSYFLDIRQSALLKCIQFDRLAFAKFLVQFNYFSKAMLSGIGTIILERYPTNMSLPISNEMAEILQIANKKRRRENVENMQSLVDEWKERLPGGFHLEICNRLQSMYK